LEVRLLKRKWWMLLAVGIVAVVGVIGASAYFFLSGIFELFESPVDISAISISSVYAAEELLPDQLINESMNKGTVNYGWM